MRFLEKVNDFSKKNTNLDSAEISRQEKLSKEKADIQSAF